MRFLSIRVLLSALAAVLLQAERLSSLALYVQRTSLHISTGHGRCRPQRVYENDLSCHTIGHLFDCSIRTVTPTPLTDLPTPMPLPRRAITFGAIAWQ